MLQMGWAPLNLEPTNRPWSETHVTVKVSGFWLVKVGVSPAARSELQSRIFLVQLGLEKQDKQKILKFTQCVFALNNRRSVCIYIVKKKQKKR